MQGVSGWHFIVDGDWNHILPVPEWMPALGHWAGGAREVPKLSGVWFITFHLNVDLLSYNVALATSTLWSTSLTSSQRTLTGRAELAKPFFQMPFGDLFSKSQFACKINRQAMAKAAARCYFTLCKEYLVTNMWTRSGASNDNYLQSCEVGRGQSAVIPCPHDGMCQTDTHAGDTWPICILAAHVNAREGNVSGCLTVEWKGKDPVTAIGSHRIGASDKFRAENHKSCLMFVR